MTMTQLAKNIGAIRRFLRISKRRYAQILGVHESLISKVENGTVPVSPELVEAVCHKFYVEPTAIYHFDLEEGIISHI